MHFREFLVEWYTVYSFVGLAYVYVVYTVV